MEIRIAGTSNDSIVDGPGIRFTIFVQGCPHHCKGCHNPQTHSYDGGKVIDTDELLEKILANPLLDGVTFSGGEPFVYAKQLADLARKIKQNNLNIVTYSGYTFERLISESTEENGFSELLAETDILIDGPYLEAERSLMLLFRGSKNQRIVDVKKSLEKGSVVEINLDN
ncbi:MAG: anaerobic ribonucleoside-triphosphate reductase activating protein [Oscillospiraceae bacterium]|nr:anaerobic ribonucleoside-triphosphate reductase activating protein [Oscillospiraceae bacterium]